MTTSNTRLSATLVVTFILITSLFAGTAVPTANADVPDDKAFRVLDVTVTPDKIQPGDEVQVSVLVDNTGSDPITNQQITVYDNEQRAPDGAQTTVSLDPGERERLRFTFTPDLDGQPSDLPEEHFITINERESTTEVVTIVSKDTALYNGELSNEQRSYTEQFNGVSNFKDGDGTVEALENERMPPVDTSADTGITFDGVGSGDISNFAEITQNTRGVATISSTSDLRVGLSSTNLPSNGVYTLYTTYTLQSGGPVEVDLHRQDGTEVDPDTTYTLSGAAGDFETRRYQLSEDEREYVANNGRAYLVLESEGAVTLEMGFTGFITSSEPLLFDPNATTVNNFRVSDNYVVQDQGERSTTLMADITNPTQYDAVREVTFYKNGEPFLTDLYRVEAGQGTTAQHEYVLPPFDDIGVTRYTKRQHDSPGSDWTKVEQVDAEIREQHDSPGSDWTNTGQTDEVVKEQETSPTPEEDWTREEQVGWNGEILTEYSTTSPGPDWTNIGIYKQYEGDTYSYDYGGEGTIKISGHHYYTTTNPKDDPNAGYATDWGHPQNTDEMNAIFASDVVDNGVWTSNIDGVSAPQMDLPRNDKFGWKYDGWVYAPETGTYTFGTSSDDASDVFVKGQVVATYYGGHGANEYRTGQISLQKGWHPIKYRLEDKGYGEVANLHWQKPSESSLSPVPNDKLAGTQKNVLKSNVPSVTNNDPSKIRATAMSDPIDQPQESVYSIDWLSTNGIVWSYTQGFKDMSDTSSSYDGIRASTSGRVGSLSNHGTAYKKVNVAPSAWQVTYTGKFEGRAQSTDYDGQLIFSPRTSTSTVDTSTKEPSGGSAPFRLRYYDEVLYTSGQQVDFIGEYTPLEFKIVANYRTKTYDLYLDGTFQGTYDMNSNAKMGGDYPYMTYSLDEQSADFYHFSVQQRATEPVQVQGSLQSKLSMDYGIFYDNEPNYVRWAEDKSDGHNKYSYPVPRNEGSATVNTKFQALSFEESGFSLYAVDAKGNKKVILCRGNLVSDLNAPACSKDDSDLQYDGQTSVTMNNEIEQIVLATDLENALGTWYDEFRLYDMQISTDGRTVYEWEKDNRDPVYRWTKPLYTWERPIYEWERIERDPQTFTFSIGESTQKEDVAYVPFAGLDGTSEDVYDGGTV